MNVLHLTLKKKWFDMIASGEKKEEYREIKEYWKNRLMIADYVSRNSTTSYKQHTEFIHFDAVEFKNGYASNSPAVLIECKGIEVRYGVPDWGAEPWKDYFVIKLGNILTPNQTLSLDRD